jgi:hypothetical protein
LHRFVFCFVFYLFIYLFLIKFNYLLKNKIPLDHQYSSSAGIGSLSGAL